MVPQLTRTFMRSEINYAQNEYILIKKGTAVKSSKLEAEDTEKT